MENEDKVMETSENKPKEYKWTWKQKRELKKRLRELEKLKEKLEKQDVEINTKFDEIRKQVNNLNDTVTNAFAEEHGIDTETWIEMCEQAKKAPQSDILTQDSVEH